MVGGLNDFQHVFFIGVGGVGMSAVAQYLAGIGKDVSGSDRYFAGTELDDVRAKLIVSGVRCFQQNGEGISTQTELVVVSTAIEDKVEEVQKAKTLHIPIIRRSELLAMIAASKRTIAIGGTSGKSSTSAMLFDILQHAQLQPSIISGAGLVRIMRENKIGNAMVGKGEWLVIEADESDRSIVQYHPEVGVLLNIDKDHQEMDVLMEIFSTFKQHTTHVFIVNQSQAAARGLSTSLSNDFSTDPGSGAGFIGTDFEQQGLHCHFKINGVPFSFPAVGRHNMENALAAVAAAAQAGVSIAAAAEALKDYAGIYRRHQVMGEKNGVLLIDDYAHNPVKCAVSISACQALAPRVIAWFQPHGYGPTRFLRHDFVHEIAAVLRNEDEIWMSEIFYAGGTTTKDISANDLINDLKTLGKRAFFIEDRNELLDAMRPHLHPPCVLLLMGARDPSLEDFAAAVWGQL